MTKPPFLVAKLLCCAGLVLLSACASMTTYNRERRLVSGFPTATYVDAKQRVVLASPVPVGNGALGYAMRYCAEPSPDALSSIAASGGGGLSAAQKVDLQAAFTLAESASNIGLRTQSIQLMRDAMYRLCEGVVSNTLSPSQFETLYRHFQNSMVAILAIEQLTGTVRPPAIALSGTASAGAAKEIAAVTQNLVDARSASDSATTTAAASKAELTKAQAAAKAYLDDKKVQAADALTPDQQKEYAPLVDAVTKAKAQSDAAAAKAEATKANVDTYERGLSAIAAGNLSAGTTAAMETPAGAKPLPAETVAAVAQAVEAIVEQQSEAGFFREACATLFVRQIGESGGTTAPPANSLEANCAAYAKATIDSVAGSTTNAKALTDAIVRQINEKGLAALPAGLDIAQMVRTSTEPRGGFLLKTLPVRIDTIRVDDLAPPARGGAR